MSQSQNRLIRDKDYFLRKDYFERLKQIGSGFNLESSNQSFNLCLSIVNPMITPQHVFVCFDVYSPDWTNFVLVCKDWFHYIVMEDDGLLWREHFRLMLSSMTRYYSDLPPLHNSLNYRLEKFDSVIGSNEEYNHELDEKFKELPGKTWKDNYDDILNHSLGLKKNETEFDSKTTRFIAKCFLDKDVHIRNRGQLATVRELFLHKFLFDAIFPMTLIIPDNFYYWENPLRNEKGIKILEKKLYYIETRMEYDRMFDIKEMRKGIMLRISYLSSDDGLIHHRFYGTTTDNRTLKFFMDVQESSFDSLNAPNRIHSNLYEKHDFIQIGQFDSSITQELDQYFNNLEELIGRKFGNIHLAELFCKYWYSINTLEDPISVSFSDDNPFWFLDILSKSAKYSIQKKFLNDMSVSSVSVLRMCQLKRVDRIKSIDSFKDKNSADEGKKKKKQQNQVNPEFKELIQVNSKLENTFNLSVVDCWNMRGISIRRNVKGEVILEGLLCSREGILLFNISLNKPLGVLFSFEQKN